jgi:hypothetical protein
VLAAIHSLRGLGTQLLLHPGPCSGAALGLLLLLELKRIRLCRLARS